MSPYSPVTPKRQHQLRAILIAGALVAGPLAITYLAFKWLFFTLDDVLQPIITYAVGRPLPGAGLVALVLLVFGLGLLTRHVIGRKILSGVDIGLSHTPLVQMVYRGSRQVMDAIRDSKVTFSRVVLVDFPHRGAQSIAFVTGQALNINNEQRYPVFVPTTPTPMSGFLLFVPKDQIIETSLSIDEAMRMVVSGGLVCPESLGGVRAAPVPVTDPRIGDVRPVLEPAPQMNSCAEPS